MTSLINKFHPVKNGYGEFILHNVTHSQYIEIFKKCLSTLDQFKLTHQTPWTIDINSISQKYPETKPIFIPRTLYDLAAIKMGIFDKALPYDPSRTSFDPIKLQEEFANISFELNQFLLKILHHPDHPQIVHQHQQTANILAKDFIKQFHSVFEMLDDIQENKKKDFQRMLTHAIHLECSVQPTDQILYRGADLTKETLSLSLVDKIRKSLSYGSSLFAAAKEEHTIDGAASWIHGLKKFHGLHTLIIPKGNPNNSNPFFVPATHSLLYFMQKGEWFHPRTKILTSELEDSKIIGLQEPYNLEEYQDRKKFLEFKGSEQALESEWKKYMQNALNIKQCDFYDNPWDSINKSLYVLFNLFNLPQAAYQKG